MKIVADGMLGKLARWLRILGHDVKYSRDIEDAKLIAIAKKDKRVLLTRDMELYKQAIAKGLQAFYVEGKTGEEKLAEVSKRFNIALDVDMAVSRCPKCNAKVKPVAKKSVTNKVNRNTFLYYNDFWKCQRCGQIYWQGAHWEKIRKTLENAKAYKLRM
ncbi:MAG: Mut7-C RNAse domain-containing protein [Candidatus Bathyarchaeia archaeon]